MFRKSRKLVERPQSTHGQSLGIYASINLPFSLFFQMYVSRLKENVSHICDILQKNQLQLELLVITLQYTPSTLHILHPSMITISLLCKLSLVRIFPIIVSIQESLSCFSSHILLQGNEFYHPISKLYNRFRLENPVLLMEAKLSYPLSLS